jgi:hypothetical protein
MRLRTTAGGPSRSVCPQKLEHLAVAAVEEVQEAVVDVCERAWLPNTLTLSVRPNGSGMSGMGFQNLRSAPMDSTTPHARVEASFVAEVAVAADVVGGLAQADAL